MKILLGLALSLLLLRNVPEAGAFAAVNYNWPQPGGYNLDHVLRIENAPSPEFGGFFWSHQFYVGDKNSQNVLYMGLQQQMSGSRNVIFSIFYDRGTNVNPGNVVCNVPTTSCTASGTAGDQSPGAQIIAPYDWKVGREYRLRVWSVPPPGKSDSGWWAFFVMDLTAGEETLIGWIYNQNRPNGGINPTQYSVGWGEVYGGQQAYGDCAYSPQRAIWKRPTMNAGSIVAEFGVGDQQAAPFRVFVSDDKARYEMLTCSVGGQPYGRFGQTACYYLGDAGRSCGEVCTSREALPTPQCSQPLSYTRGGVGSAGATMPYLGTPGQGGDSQRCNELVTQFGFPGVEASTRINPSEGLGCHVYPPKSWYLLAPNTENSAAAPGARRVCGCVPYLQ